MSLRKMLKAAAQILYPEGIKCIVCDEELSKDSRYCMCGECELPHNETYCTVCGRAIAAQNIVCDQCKKTVMPFDGARSSFIYRDNAALLVRRLKYGNAAYLARYMAEFMTDTFFSTSWHVDVVTFVPIHKSRRRTRGYNQSELLAREMAKRINLPVAELLEKTVKTRSMVGLGREKRSELIRGTIALKAEPESDIRGKTVLLVDDVLTTGATAGECTEVLRKAKCGGVYVLTFASGAATPLTV